MAGAEGFEPPKAVLETAGLPLAYAPPLLTPEVNTGGELAWFRPSIILLNFFVRLVLAAERAELSQFQPLRLGLLVLRARVVLVLALAALKRYDFAHSISLALCAYAKISDTVPAPTVRPPSRIANRRPFSMATGVINSTSSCTLSPGITISIPSGNCATPVTSVVRK